MSTTDLSPTVLLKLQILQKKLGVNDLETALDKSLDIAKHITDAVDDPSRKLLVEHKGKFTELKAIA